MATEKTDVVIVGVGAAGWKRVPKGRLRVAQHGSARLFLRRTQCWV